MTSVPFDPAAVRALAGILVETGLTEIEIEGKDGRIRVVRAPPPMIAPQQTVSVPMPAAAVAAPAAPVVDDARHPGAVLSPMVGVAYLSSEPSAPAYVTLGQTVSAGQTLLLIEAMKTFNQIKATKPGTVTKILIASGSPVEYGEPLMIVE